ncbi:MAG: alanine--tRNA ligase [Candidatus Vogelbacteria bacterium]|nr:alanine--tRNA ligase [Candidatus Vogelbacteria bacterium]
MESKKIRQKFLDFFAKRGHKIVPSASLVPTDPSVLFTTAGMQPFKPYYADPAAARRDFGVRNLASIQKCFRTSDIDEVGDESHLTFFEMLGNFSFGGYGKKEAIEYAHEFITEDLGLEVDYVTVFEGGDGIEKDEESEKIWRGLGLTDIRFSGRADNFWGPTGSEGPCGPTTEIYVNGVEIWNLVFNEYYCQPGGQLERLPTFGVDTGMGLERLAMVTQSKPNIFATDLFEQFKDERVLADHARAIAFLSADGIRPENKGAGYIWRRLFRRLLARFDLEKIKLAIDWMVEKYSGIYPELRAVNIFEIIAREQKQFAVALDLGLKELTKVGKIDAVGAFKLYETYGLPYEVIKDQRPDLSRDEFEKEFERHQEVSRAGLTKKFAGGLADHEPATIKLHTAHHLLLAALQSVLGKNIKQRGSNINQTRLRLDFSFDRKLTEEEKRQVEDLVNEKIRENLAVIRREMPRAEAEKIGAEMEFGGKYGETVSVYFIGDPSTSSGQTFSLEFCAGPHVARTGELGRFRIIKEEPIAAGLRRIKAVLE